MLFFSRQCRHSLLHIVRKVLRYSSDIVISGSDCPYFRVLFGRFFSINLENVCSAVELIFHNFSVGSKCLVINSHEIGKGYGVLGIYIPIASTNAPIKSFLLLIGLRANRVKIVFISK